VDLERLKADPFIQADPDFAVPASATIDCTPVTTTDSMPGTQVVTLDALAPEACIIAFRHLHSLALPADPDWGEVAVVDTPDPRDAELFPPGVPLTPSDPRLPGQQDLRTVGTPGGPVSIWYQFVLKQRPHLSIAFNNTVVPSRKAKATAGTARPRTASASSICCAVCRRPTSSSARPRPATPTSTAGATTSTICRPCSR
jgi:hypothetical protein